MIRFAPTRIAVAAIDMHRRHLDPTIATVPLAAELARPPALPLLPR